MIKRIARRGLTPFVLWDVMSYKEDKNVLPVLFYHRVEDGRPKDYMTVSKVNFKRQMDLLKRYGFNAVSLEDAYDFLSKKRELPPRSILITFDDGFKDNYTNTFPILLRHGFTATVFLTVEKIGRYKDYLSWSDVKAMYSAGFSIGSHTLTHPNLDRLSDEAVREELVNSKSLIEIELKRAVDFLCYPKGRFNDSVKRLAKEAGYKAAFSVLPGYNRKGADLYELKRIQIGNRDSLMDFKGKLFGTYIPLQKYYHARSIIDDIKSSLLPAKKVNILYVIWSLGLGGAERVVINLAKGLNRSRYKPIICCLNDKGEFANELEKEGIEVIALNKKGKFDISIVGKIMSVIKKHDIAIVNTHLWGANLWGRIAAKLAGVPVVITEHNEDTWKPRKFLYIDRMLSRFTDRVIAVSNTVKDFYVKKAGIKADKIRVVYNGIDSKRYGKMGTDTIYSSDAKEINGVCPHFYNESLLAMTEGTIVLGMIGRLVPQKGHTYFLDALSKLSEVYNIKGLIIGSGPLENELKVYAERIGLKDKVVFTGLRHDVPELLKTIDILVMPSLREGLSITALEAMASGVPVVATDVGGNPELIIDGETGILVPPRDAEAIERAINWIIMDRGYYEYLSNSSRTRVRGHFDISSMVRNTVAIYDEILGGDGGYVIASERSERSNPQKRDCRVGRDVNESLLAMTGGKASSNDRIHNGRIRKQWSPRDDIEDEKDLELKDEAILKKFMEKIW